MHECKGEEVLNANLIGASSGRGKGSMKVSLYRTSQMFIADGGVVEAVGEAGCSEYRSGPSENRNGNKQ